MLVPSFVNTFKLLHAYSVFDQAPALKQDRWVALMQMIQMKKAVIYIILFSYSLMLLRPTVPFIADIIAHTFWYSQHIATVHVENGKYHVHYQYMNEAQKSIPGKNPHNIRTETFMVDHIFSGDRFDLSLSIPNEKKFRELSFYIPELMVQHPFPPPRS
jgi:hypothetical protein